MFKTRDAAAERGGKEERGEGVNGFEGAGVSLEGGA